MNESLQKTEKIIRTLLLIALIGYVLFVLWYTVFSRESDPDALCYQGELFWSIKGAIANPQGNLPEEILYNCLMLIPVGFSLAWVLSPLVTDEYCGIADTDNKTKSAGKTRSESRVFIITAIAGFLFTCTIELLQLVLHKGLFEYDDIIYNTFGTIVGYLIYKLTRKIVVALISPRVES